MPDATRKQLEISLARLIDDARQVEKSYATLETTTNELSDSLQTLLMDTTAAEKLLHKH